MQIRDMEKDDLSEVRRFVNRLWSRDELWGPGRAAAYKSERGSVIVAMDGTRPVAVAAYTPARIPRFGVLQLDVADGSQRSGIGTALVAELRRRHSGHRMMMRVRPWDEATGGFAVQRGFAVGERVIEGWLDPATQPVGDWIDRALLSVRPSIRILPLDESGCPPEVVALLLESWFQRHHRWLDRPWLSAVEAVGRYLEPALAGTIHVASVAGEPVGAGVLLPDPFGQKERGAHLAYLGVGPSGCSDERPIVAGLLAHCLASARQQHRPVQVEIQKHHLALHGVIDDLPTQSLYEGLVVYVG